MPFQCKTSSLVKVKEGWEDPGPTVGIVSYFASTNLHSFKLPNNVERFKTWHKKSKYKGQIETRDIDISEPMAGWEEKRGHCYKKQKKKKNWEEIFQVIVIFLWFF